MKQGMIEDISELIANLEYLKKFMKDEINEDNELGFLSKTSTLHTDIILLKQKLKKK